MSFPSNIPLGNLQPSVRQFVEEHAARCKPAKIHVCDGSEEENQSLITFLIQKGSLVKLSKHENRCVCVCVC